MALISSGTSTQESAFLDASESGEDAFFLTSQPLVGQDQDNDFDVYDARVCTSASPCLSQALIVPESCETAQTCNSTPPAAQPSFTPPASATFSGPPSDANGGTLPLKETTPAKPLTRSQKLTRALKACRHRYDGSKRKRGACEARARKRYAPQKAGNAKRSAQREGRVT